MMAASSDQEEEPADSHRCAARMAPSPWHRTLASHSDVEGALRWSHVIKRAGARLIMHIVPDTQRHLPWHAASGTCQIGARNSQYTM